MWEGRVAPVRILSHLADVLQEVFVLYVFKQEPEPPCFCFAARTKWEQTVRMWNTLLYVSCIRNLVERAGASIIISLDALDTHDLDP